MVEKRNLEDMYVIQVPGENAWKSAKEIIKKFYFKGDYYEGKFIMDISNTFKSPGFTTYVQSKKDLEKKFDFIESNHVKEGNLFSVAFHNLYISENENGKKEKIKEEVYQLL